MLLTLFPSWLINARDQKLWKTFFMNHRLSNQFEEILQLSWGGWGQWLWSVCVFVAGRGGELTSRRILGLRVFVVYSRGLSSDPHDPPSVLEESVVTAWKGLYTRPPSGP